MSAGKNSTIDNDAKVGIWTYETNDSETYPYKIMDCGLGEEPMCHESFMLTNINSLALSASEDSLFMISENQQLVKMTIQLDGTDMEEEPVVEYIHERFHYGPITGMDICLRKQLIVTCSN